MFLTQSAMNYSQVHYCKFSDSGLTSESLYWCSLIFIDFIHNFHCWLVFCCYMYINTVYIYIYIHIYTRDIIFTYCMDKFSIMLITSHGWINRFGGPGAKISPLVFGLCTAFLCWNITWPQVCCAILWLNTNYFRNMYQVSTISDKIMKTKNKNMGFWHRPSRSGNKVGSSLMTSSCQLILCFSRAYSQTELQLNNLRHSKPGALGASGQGLSPQQ